MKIQFFNEEIKVPKFNKQAVRNIAKTVSQNEQALLSNVNIIFCSDSYLLEINKQYLQHDYFTDIITFSYPENKASINSDMFISVERVSENAQNLNITIFEELYRVIIHGLLHLSGYDDSTNDLKEKMSFREDFYLSLLQKDLV